MFTINEEEMKKRQMQMIYDEFFKITRDEEYSSILTKIQMKHKSYPSIVKIKNYFKRKLRK